MLASAIRKSLTEASGSLSKYAIDPKNLTKEGTKSFMAEMAGEASSFLKGAAGWGGQHYMGIGGAIAGGIHGGLSNEGSVLGGAFKGAALGYGAAFAHRGYRAYGKAKAMGFKNPGEIGLASAARMAERTFFGASLKTNKAVNPIRSSLKKSPSTLIPKYGKPSPPTTTSERMWHSPPTTTSERMRHLSTSAPRYGSFR